MKEHNLQILESLSEIISHLSQAQKEDLLSYGEKMAFGHSFNDTKAIKLPLLEKEKDIEHHATGKSKL